MKNVIYPIAILLLVGTGCAHTDEEKFVPKEGRYASIQGKKIYYEEYGTGMPLLLLSGGGHNRSIEDFYKCIPGLAEHFRVIAPDSPAQGKSEQPDSISYEILTNTMSAFIDSLEVDSLYVMGWSDGGIMSILLAERRADKVKRAIAVGANNGKRGFNIPADVPLESVVPPSPEVWAKLNQESVDKYLKDPGKDWKKLLRQLSGMVYANEYFPVSVYERIHIPVMIVLGDRDDISIEHGTEMHKAIKGSQFCVLPNTTHEVFSEQAGLINSVTIKFLENEE